MPIAELGYRPWQGRRTGRLSRCLAIARSEVAIALEGSKLLRRFLILAWIPILYYCPFFLAVGYVANPANELGEGTVFAAIARQLLPGDAVEVLRTNPHVILPGIWSIAFYFFFAYTQSFLSMIVVAITGPPLIAKDLRSKAFLVYFSKPIQPWQYLLGKLATVAFFVFSMTLFPALFLYAVSVALAPDLVAGLATFPIVLKIVAASVAIAVPVALVVMLLSSLTKDRRIATFAWLAVWIFGEIAFRVLSMGGHSHSGFKPPPWAALLSLRELTTRATSGIFEVQTHLNALLQQFGASGSRMERTLRQFAREMGDANLIDRPLSQTKAIDLAGSGYPPIVSIAVLAGISLVCVLILRRRITQPVRI